MTEPYFYEIKLHDGDLTREWRFKWCALGIYCAYAVTTPVVRAGVTWAQCVDSVSGTLELETLRPKEQRFGISARDLQLQLIPAANMARLQELAQQRVQERGQC